MEQFRKAQKNINEVVNFDVDFSSQSIFVKNPLNQQIELPEETAEEPERAKGVVDVIFNVLDNHMEKYPQDCEVAKKFKIMLKFFKFKETLNKLNRINKSVDELVGLKIPYGESEKRYQVLANRLMKANNLRTELQREFM
jgi:hypothetical protein